MSLLRTILDYLLGIWKRIPPDARKKVIAAIVEALDELIREFYRRFKKK